MYQHGEIMTVGFWLIKIKVNLTELKIDKNPR